MQQFAIGQRYLSDNETQLGLGVIIEVDTRTVRVLFPQSEETRLYAIASSNLSRVLFAVGDSITDQDDNCHIVAGVEDIDGVVRYHLTCGKSLMETRLSANITLAKPLERLLAGQIEDDSAYQIRQSAKDIQSIMSRHPLRGLIGGRVDIIAHQLYIASEVGKRLFPRVLLADEVGLGKTIEAGLIMHEQLLTGKATRILVLVPDSLQYQWLIELKRRFNLDFSVFDLVRTASIKEHNPTQNVFTTEQCIIASIDLLLDHADLFEQAYSAGFDMLVVDEAHHLHWDSVQGGNDKYALVEALSQKIKGLLLLTATPEQLGVESHFARLRLLDKDRFDDLQAFIDEQDDFVGVAGMATALIDNLSLSPKQLTALSKVLDINIEKLADINDNTATREYAIDELLDRHGTGRVLFRNTRESVTGFLGRQVIGYPLPLPASWQNTVRTNGKLSEQLWGEELLTDGSWLEDDPRVPWLINLLKTTLKHEKVLLIARSGAVVQALEMALRLHAGIKTASFTEEMSLLERDQAAAYFADESGASILLASEIGSEGRNFQFAHHLVLFDLPANADTLEQRIGRLDRIGQSQKITLHTPFVVGTAQERLYHWYNSALNIFSDISPTAQTVQETLITDLKPLLLAQKSDNFDSLEALIEYALNLRLDLEAQLQAGRDRLLEYSSCRPQASKQIVQQMHKLDSDSTLPHFLGEFLNAVNIDYTPQKDGSWVIHPVDSIQIDQEIAVNLPIDETGMTVVFDRQKALVQENLAYITYEHPLILSIYDMLSATSFGNTSMAVLKTSALPQGFLLLDTQFNIQSVAPKYLNINGFLPNNRTGAIIAQTHDDLTDILSKDKLNSLTQRLDKQQARQIIKMRHRLIADMYETARQKATDSLPDIGAVATQKLSDYYDKEIDRLVALQKINANIQDSEIDTLKSAKAQGINALSTLSLVPDSVRLLVVVNP